MNGIFIYLQHNRRNLRRGRLFRDRVNPLDVYDDTEIRGLFHSRRCNISIVEDLLPHLEVVPAEVVHLLHCSKCIVLRFYAVILRCMDKRPPICRQPKSVGFITHSQNFTAVYCIAY